MGLKWAKSGRHFEAKRRDLMSSGDHLGGVASMLERISVIGAVRNAVLEPWSNGQTEAKSID
jgi:hypothetical protein